MTAFNTTCARPGRPVAAGSRTIYRGHVAGFSNLRKPSAWDYHQADCTHAVLPGAMYAKQHHH
ncbi:hypothetical protein [Lysobacter olei]